MNISLKKHSESIFWFDLCPNNESDFISIYLIIDEKVALIDLGLLDNGVDIFHAEDECIRILLREALDTWNDQTTFGGMVWHVSRHKATAAG